MSKKKTETFTSEPMEYRPVSELSKLEGNPRTITKDDMDILVDSIRSLGFLEGRPLQLSDRTGQLVIIAGNQRLEAARILEIESVPTVLYKGLTEDQEIEITARDNINNGRWDWDELANNEKWADELLDAWGLDIPGANNADEEWVGMPEYDSNNEGPYRQLVISFNNQEAVAEFAELLGQTVTDKTKSLWFPMAIQGSSTDEQYI